MEFVHLRRCSGVPVTIRALAHSTVSIACLRIEHDKAHYPLDGVAIKGNKPGPTNTLEDPGIRTPCYLAEKNKVTCLITTLYFVHSRNMPLPDYQQ